MSMLKLRAPSHATVAAYLALFVALSGTAYAAVTLPAHSVGTKQLKSHAVTAGKVKGNTLTGTQINESKLGKVPNASHADSAANAANAANAAKLGGVGASSYLKAAVERISAVETDCGSSPDATCQLDLVNADGFVVRSDCSALFGGVIMNVSVVSAPAGSLGGGFYNYKDPDPGSNNVEVSSADLSTPLWSATELDTASFAGRWVLISPSHTITIDGFGRETYNPGNSTGACSFHGAALIQ